MRRAALWTIVLALSAGLPATAAELSDISWFEGADGLELALEEVERDGKPLVIYFRTDWCPYFRQFEQDLLDTEEVELFMKKLVCVTINPESGPNEMRIASSYGVRSYPTMVIHPPTLEQPRYVQRTLRGEDGQVRLMTPVEFVQFLSRAAHD